MTKIFISHAHEDKELTHQITIALAKAGFEPWLDVQELSPGDELLKTIAAVLTEADHFVIVLSRTALTKPWVFTEMRMALSAEIEKGHPKVIVLRLDDCEVPIELRHKLYLDFCGRFEEAITELADHISGMVRDIPFLKQTILSEMVKNADSNLWGNFTSGVNFRDGWRQVEAADSIRNLSSNELEAAVAIGWSWSGQDYKMWEDDLLRVIHRVADTSDAGARRIIKRLVDSGYLLEADDLDYRDKSEKAWCDGSILWILRRFARRSGLFPALPPPLPESLSSLLTYDRTVNIFAKGWWAVRFTAPILTVMDDSQTVVAVVSRVDYPARSWGFRLVNDRDPLIVESCFSLAGLIPEDPLNSHSEGHESIFVHFDLATFDDLGLLRG